MKDPVLLYANENTPLASRRPIEHMTLGVHCAYFVIVIKGKKYGRKLTILASGGDLFKLCVLRLVS